MNELTDLRYSTAVNFIEAKLRDQGIESRETAYHVFWELHDRMGDQRPDEPSIFLILAALNNMGYMSCDILLRCWYEEIEHPKIIAINPEFVRAMEMLYRVWCNDRLGGHGDTELWAVINPLLDQCDKLFKDKS